MFVSRRALHWLKVWMNKKMYLEKWIRNPGDPSRRENACSDFLPVQAQALRALTFAILQRIPEANAEFFVSPSTIAVNYDPWGTRNTAYNRAWREEWKSFFKIVSTLIGLVACHLIKLACSSCNQPSVLFGASLITEF